MIDQVLAVLDFEIFDHSSVKRLRDRGRIRWQENHFDMARFWRQDMARRIVHEEQDVAALDVDFIGAVNRNINHRIRFKIRQIQFVLCNKL